MDQFIMCVEIGQISDERRLIIICKQSQKLIGLSIQHWTTRHRFRSH